MSDSPVGVYFALGSDLGDRLANLAEAVGRLDPSVEVRQVSPVYETAPMGPPDQPWYLNAVCGGLTRLEPVPLLHFVKAIERAMGRLPGARWGPRSIDIDILLYGDLRLETPELTIPHAGLAQREFVLRPLADLAPALVLPGAGRTVAQLLAERAGQSSVRPWRAGTWWLRTNEESEG